jgi:glucokinase
VSTVIGVDLGGTKVAAALLRDGELGEPIQHPTELSSSAELVEQLAAIVSEASGAATLQAVGVGVPSVVQFATGKVVSSANIPLQDVELRHVLGERLGVPVFVDNDATVAALAEAHDEQLQLVSENLVMLTIGTGVGGGIVLGGRIFRGATGGAGELGHTLIGLPAGDLTRPEDEIPLAGEHFAQPGSLEVLASGHGLDRLARAVATAEPDSPLGLKGAAEGIDAVRGSDAVEAARAGDPLAAAAVNRWARAIGVGIANAINTFDPQEVVIGGGAAAAGELLLGPAVELAAGYVLPGLRGHANVRMARFGARAGVLGAALLARQELEGTP